MIFIAHRGNIHGPAPTSNLTLGNPGENTPYYINKSLGAGFYAEVDVSVWNGNLCFGHDKGPSNYTIKESDLNEKCFYHLKDIESKRLLDKWSKLTGSAYKYFFNHMDSYSLVSDGHIWTYTGACSIDEAELNSDTIYMSKESPSYISKGLVRKLMDHGVYGVCSDYVQKFKLYHDEILLD